METVLLGWGGGGETVWRTWGHWAGGYNIVAAADVHLNAKPNVLSPKCVPSPAALIEAGLWKEGGDVLAPYSGQPTVAFQAT